MQQLHHRVRVAATTVVLAGTAGLVPPAAADAAVTGPAPTAASVVSSEAARVNDATIVPDPSWTCGMPRGIVPPTRGRLVLRATAEVGAVRDVGITQYGHRRVIDVRGGTVTGDRVSGTIVAGGLDLNLTLATGTVEDEQVNVLRMDDGTLVYLRTCGVAPTGTRTVRIVPDFEAPTSSTYAWLNAGTFVGTSTLTPAGTLEMSIYDVSTVSAPAPTLRLRDPRGVPNQSWDCQTATGTAGATLYSEFVTLGAALTVGESKRGTRNIIPITGGTMTGRIAGSVVSAGADYQLIGSTVALDARYLLSTNDGEFILVRNCGELGRLVPVFEARAAGPYRFLNAGRWLSSDPDVSADGVRLTFYERV